MIATPTIEERRAPLMIMNQQSLMFPQNVIKLTPNKANSAEAKKRALISAIR